MLGHKAPSKSSHKGRRFEQNPMGIVLGRGLGRVCQTPNGGHGSLPSAGRSTLLSPETWGAAGAQSLGSETNL